MSTSRRWRHLWTMLSLVTSALLCWLRDSWKTVAPVASALAPRRPRSRILLRKVAGLGLVAGLFAVDMAWTFQDVREASFAALLARRKILASDDTSSPSLGWLRPSPTLPTGLTFDATSGKVLGTVVDHAEPTWAITDTTITDSGNAATNMAALQAKVDALAATASGHTKIVIPIATYDGTFTFKQPSHAYRIGIVVANAETNLPAYTPSGYDGTTEPSKTAQITASHLSSMAKFRPAGNTNPVLATETNTGGYWVRGVALINEGHYTMATMANLQGLISSAFVQCYQSGEDDATHKNVPRGFYMWSNDIAFVDCWMRRNGQTSGADTQCINWIGGARMKVINCNLQGTGPCETFMSGGVALPGDDIANLPSDLEFRWNTCSTPVEADDDNTPINFKNLFEVKYGQRFLIEGNAFTRYIPGGQAYAIAIKLTNQGGGGTTAKTRNICARFNRFTNCGGGIVAITGRDAGNEGLETPDRIEFSHNLAFDPQILNYGAMALYGCTNLKVHHNTIRSAGAGVLSAETHVDFQWNVIAWNDGDGAGYVWTDVVGSRFADIDSGAAYRTVDSVVTNNYWTQSAASGYTGNTLVGLNVSSMGFVDASADNYALSGSSAGYQADSGRDAGVYLPLLNDLIAGII